MKGSLVNADRASHTGANGRDGRRTAQEGAPHGEPEVRGVRESGRDRQLQGGRSRAGLHPGGRKLPGGRAGEGAGDAAARARLRRRAPHRRRRGPAAVGAGGVRRRPPARRARSRAQAPGGRVGARGRVHQHGHPVAARHGAGVRAAPPRRGPGHRLHGRPGPPGGDGVGRRGGRRLRRAAHQAGPARGAARPRPAARGGRPRPPARGSGSLPRLGAGGRALREAGERRALRDGRALPPKRRRAQGALHHRQRLRRHVPRERGFGLQRAARPHPRERPFPPGEPAPRGPHRPRDSPLHALGGDGQRRREGVRRGGGGVGGRPREGQGREVNRICAPLIIAMDP